MILSGFYLKVILCNTQLGFALAAHSVDTQLMFTIAKIQHFFIIRIKTETLLNNHFLSAFQIGYCRIIVWV